jgi:Ubiquitin 3 binding protein But2 C-terminal domain
MKSLIALGGLISLAFSSPLVITDSRPLEPRADTSNCPGYLNDGFLFPLLIVPVSQAQPDKQFGNVYSPVVTPNDICKWLDEI